MKKIILIGRTGSGKTTLCQKLHSLKLEYKKTQTVELYDHAIDTPGEYLENRHFYSALIMSAVDADCIALVGDPTASENFIPPAFSGAFAKEVIGIVTKIKLATEEQQIQNIVGQLKNAGVSKVFLVDTVQNIGVRELFEYLMSDKQ